MVLYEIAQITQRRLEKPIRGGNKKDKSVRLKATETETSAALRAPFTYNVSYCGRRPVRLSNRSPLQLLLLLLQLSHLCATCSFRCRNEVTADDLLLIIPVNSTHFQQLLWTANTI